ncbi:MAG TPA: ABC transporter permease [Gemmataceae bacterium]|nr:ABC transporter permease [Gemmataceae bacterium]
MGEAAFRWLIRAGRVLAALVLLAMLAPFAYAVWMSFAPGVLLEPPTDRWSLRWYREFLGSAKWTAALQTTAEVAALSVVGSLVGGLGVAVAVTRYHFRGRSALSGAVLLPMFVPAVVLGMGLLPLVRGVGLQGMAVAIAAAHSLASLPVVFLLLRSALSQVDPELERAARGLGAGPVTAFRRVTLPLVSPAIAAGAVIACILSVNEFTLALFLGTPRTLPAALWPESRYQETPLIAAASCLSVLVTLLGMGLAARLWRISLSRPIPSA